MRATWTVMRAESRTAWRTFATRFNERPGVMMLFTFLTLMLTIMVVKLMTFVAENPADFEDTDTGYGQLLLTFFVVLTMRSAGAAYRRVMRSPLLSFHMAQPVTPRGVMLGMFGAQLVASLALTAAVLFFFLMAWLITWFALPIPGGVLPLLLLVALLAPLCGFLFALLGVLQPLGRRLGYLGALGVLLGLLMVSLNYADEHPAAVGTLLLITVLALFTGLVFADGFFAEGYYNQHSMAVAHTSRGRLLSLRWLDPIVGREVGTIARKEVINALRERDVVGANITTIFLGPLLVGMWYMGLEAPGDMADETFYGLMLATCIFTGTLLQCILIGAAMVGVEGKRLWLFKSMPLRGTTVMHGKAVALLLLTAPSMMLVWLPLPLVAQFSWKLTLFFGVLTLLMLLANIGLGIWAGSTFANFEEANRGNPDFMTQTMLIGTSAFLAFVLLSLPLGVMLVISHNLGLVAVAAVCFIGYAIYRIGIRAAGVGYRSIYIDAYG